MQHLGLALDTPPHALSRDFTVHCSSPAFFLDCPILTVCLTGCCPCPCSTCCALR